MTRLSAKGNGPSSVDSLEVRKRSPRFPTQEEADARLRARRWQRVKLIGALALIAALVYLITGT